MIRTTIKRGQIWKNNLTGKRYQIVGTHGRKWRAKTLDRAIQDIHSLTNQTLWTKFYLEVNIK